MKNTILIIAIIILVSSCKKNNGSLIGSSMTVTRNGTTLHLTEVNIFTPNGDGKNDEFLGPIYCLDTAGDSVLTYSLKINGNSSGGIWSGTNASEGVYSYEADYTTVNGTAKATGLLRLYRSSPVPCGEKPLYRFPQAYGSNCFYDSLSAYNEDLSCQ